MQDSFLRRLIFKTNAFLNPTMHGETAYTLISEAVDSDKPLMIARIGAVEIKGLLYAKLHWPLYLLLKSYTYKHMPLNAGFFPANEESFKRFAERMLDDFQQCDILASWRPEEMLLKKYLGTIPHKISLDDLNPNYNSSFFWTEALRDKKVLVVHPFTETIRRQYERRENLFNGKDFLPGFRSLQVIKAVQSSAGNDSGFTDWFAALKYMEEQIDRSDYDIALIGCGAYGLPLAAHVKRSGHQAIHLGGVLQLYFGIKGRRWDDWGIYNDYWVSPSDKETPSKFKSVEDGCYW